MLSVSVFAVALFSYSVIFYATFTRHITITVFFIEAFSPTSVNQHSLSVPMCTVDQSIIFNDERIQTITDIVIKHK